VTGGNVSAPARFQHPPARTNIEQVPAGALDTGKPWQFTGPMPPEGEKSENDGPRCGCSSEGFDRKAKA